MNRLAALSACTAALAVLGVVGPQTPAASARPSGPKACVPLIGTNQLIPPLPGIVTPLPGDKSPAVFTVLPPARSQSSLPRAVHLRDGTVGFNSFLETALRRGSIYVRPRHSVGVWRKVPTPGCLDGHVVGVSVNNNMLVALDRDGWIYSLDNLLAAPVTWNWTRLYGAPIWLWPGLTVPNDPHNARKWSLSHRISRRFTDPAGNTHHLTAGLVQVVALTGGGSRIVFLDPWLPADYSYEIGGPVGGRFISEAVSTSGSVTFVTNRHGDMYTRAYDLDFAGSNNIPHRYTWQRHNIKRAQAPSQLEERFNPGFTPVALPAKDWHHQPKVPGEVTSRISIHDSGPAVEDRELRVEGRRNGATGFWHKSLYATAWRFTPTGDRLARPILDADPSTDQSSLTLAPPTGVHFAGALPDGWRLSATDFDWAQTRHPMVLKSPSGRTYPVTLATTDGLRFVPRGPGLDAQPRSMDGALDVREAKPWATDSGELRRFVKQHLQGRDIFEVGVQVSSRSLVISPAGILQPPLATLTRR
ncbi:hypothetical protein [Gordonia crocea]|uniref:hypothetical protein n=1 Tax=Gordonia crocea TaxID=589162 RepID=UPI001E33982E|nr:hypothetical protein [Gordonia crocea]